MASSELRQRHQATAQHSKSTSFGSTGTASSVGSAAGDSLEEDSNRNANRSRNETVTELPILQENGQPATERTEIPSSPREEEEVRSSGVRLTNFLQDAGAATTAGEPISRRTTSAFGSAIGTDSGMDTSVTSIVDGGSNGSSGNKSQSQVAKAEGKKRKILTRAVSGAMMIGTFLGLMYLGHLYICLLVALVELLLVRNVFVGIVFVCQPLYNLSN